MPYVIQPLSEMVKQLEKDVALAMDLNELPVICSERAIAFAVGAAKRDIHDHIGWLAKQIVPNSNSDDQTIIEAATYEGVPRKLEAKAIGTASIAASIGSSLAIDTIFQHASGLKFMVTNSDSPLDGFIHFEFVALVAGAAGNLINESLVISLISPVPGIESDATINAINGGADLEPIAELLGRLQFRKQNPPMGGAVHDYKAWALEVAEVTRAWPIDAYQGGSTMGLAFVCDNLADIIPTDDKMNEVASYIYKHEDPATGDLVGRPGGIELVLFKLTLKTVQLAIKLSPDTSDTRATVIANLAGLERAYASHGSTIKLSQVRTAIGQSTGVFDYECDLTADITSTTEELITFGVPIWTV